MTVVIRARKVFLNKLLNRRQLVVDIIHPDKANASKADISKYLAAKYKVDERNVVVYGLKTQFGGGRSSGFALVYENQQYLLKYEPKFRLRRREILPKRASNRKAWKELKTKIRKSRGKERSKLYVSRKTDKVEEIRKLKQDYLKTFVAK